MSASICSCRTEQNCILRSLAWCAASRSKTSRSAAVRYAATESGRLCYIGTDNYEAGKAVGRLVKEVMPNGGTVAIFVGQITPINARLRFQGVVDELAGQKDAKGPTFGKEDVSAGLIPQAGLTNE